MLTFVAVRGALLHSFDSLHKVLALASTLFVHRRIASNSPCAIKQPNVSSADIKRGPRYPSLSLLALLAKMNHNAKIKMFEKNRLDKQNNGVLGERLAIILSRGYSAKSYRFPRKAIKRNELPIELRKNTAQ